jgi:hypothetical protein
MLHGKIELKSVGNGAYYRVRYNQFNDRVYNRRTCLISFSLPSKGLINKYEEKKHNFLQIEYESYLQQSKAKEIRSRELDKQEIEFYIDKILSDDTKFYNTRNTFDWRIIKNTFQLKIDTAKYIKTLADNRAKEKKESAVSLN